MPQPFILPANPTFGTQLAQQLSQGINTGLEKGLANGLSGFLQQKKELGKVPNALKQAFGKDFDKLPPQDRLKLIEQTTEATRQSGSALGSSLQIAQSYFNPPDQQNQSQNEQVSESPSKLKEAFKFRSNQEVGESLKTLGQKTAYPFVNVYDTLREYFSPNAAAEQDLARQGYTPGIPPIK